LELIYGKSKISTKTNEIFLCEENLQIPFGTTGFESPLSLIKTIEKTKIQNKFTYEHFIYQDYSLWWFIYPTIFPTIKKIINFIDEFEKIVVKKNFTHVRVVGEFDKLSLIKQICIKHNIQFSFSSSQYLKYKSKTKLISKIQKNRFKNITETKIKIRKNLFDQNFNIPDISNKILFAIPTIYRRKIYDVFTNTSINGEYIQGSIIKILQKMNFEIIGMDLDYTFRGHSEILEQRLNESIPWFPIEKIFSTNTTAAIKIFIKNYLKFISNQDFTILFNYREINFWNEIKPEFVKLSFLPHLPTYLKIIENFSEFLKKNKPKAVFLPYENGPLALSLMLACESNKIKTIGIQHGIIYPKSPSYSHDIFRNKETPFGMPLPDLTLLFGNYTKNLLTNIGKYPKEQFCVFGNPEFFSRDKILSSLKSNNLREKYSISSNKKIILFATSKMQQYYNFYGKLNYDEQVWEYLLNKLENSDEYFIILKPHPDENINIYKKILSKYNIKNVKIIKDDLFELVNLSDLVISIVSTVLIDALCLKTSVIKVDFNFSNPIYDNESSLTSSSLNNLFPSIIHFFNTKSSISKSDGEDFLNEHYNIKNNYSESILMEILK
jgi:hypothetical protein